MNQNIISTLVPFASEIILLFSSMAVLLSGLYEKINKYIQAIAMFSIVFSLFALIYTSSYDVEYIFDRSLIRDDIGDFFKYVCFLIFIIQILISPKYLKEKGLYIGEFYSLLILALLGTFVIISSNNIIILYLGIELSSLSLYSLVALNKKDIFSTEASIKYFVLSIIASALILFGFSYLYGISGSINIHEITSYNFEDQNYYLYLLSFILVFIGVAFKFAAAPFHMWLPDVYEGSLSIITIFISSIPKISFFVIVYRLLIDNSISSDLFFSNFLLSIGVLSVVVGNLYALVQKKIMRLVAYSGIANSGFIFLSFFIAINDSFVPGIFYIVIYSFSVVSIISLISFLSSCNFSVTYISDLKGLKNRSTLLSFLFLVTLLSLAGIPLTAGFYAKYLVLLSLINQGHFYIVLITILMTVIGLFYYLRVIWYIYFEDNVNTLVNIKGLLIYLILLLLPILIIILFILPDLLLSHIKDILT